MNTLFNHPAEQHLYTVASIGLNKNVDKAFSSREVAKDYMYNYCNKHSIVIRKIYDDKHYKTYICDNGVRFFINRAY